MRLIEVSLPSLAAQLALDEALLDEAEDAPEPLESLRLWEWPTTAVIIGRASQIAREVDLDFCDAHDIPVLRRTSGGCAVVIGRGCLLYSVILSLERRPEMQLLEEVHRFVPGRIREALLSGGCAVEQQGTCDLVLEGRKFSGNSLRYKRRNLLYHGTLLYDFDLTWLDRCLRHPPREPEYRQARRHSDFVTNITLPPQFREQLQQAFAINETVREVPQKRISQLLAEKYDRSQWHRER